MMELDYFGIEDNTLSLIDNFLVIASTHWIGGNLKCIFLTNFSFLFIYLWLGFGYFTNQSILLIQISR